VTCVVHVPYVLEQDGEGVWCASAQLSRLGVKLMVLTARAARRLSSAGRPGRPATRLLVAGPSQAPRGRGLS